MLEALHPTISYSPVLPEQHRSYHAENLGRTRPEEDDTGSLDLVGERVVLRQEAVSRVQHRHSVRGAHGEKSFLVDVARDADGFGGEGDMLGGRVGFGEDGERGEGECGRGSEDAERNLAAVRDEELVAHLGWQVEGEEQGRGDPATPRRRLGSAQIVGNRERRAQDRGTKGSIYPLAQDVGSRVPR